MEVKLSELVGNTMRVPLLNGKQRLLGVVPSLGKRAMDYFFLKGRGVIEYLVVLSSYPFRRESGTPA